jgi:hypothetical protein
VCVRSTYPKMESCSLLLRLELWWLIEHWNDRLHVPVAELMPKNAKELKR